MRAVPAAAMISAPAMAARSRATASDKRRCAPRKLRSTACAFWMMKIITTIKPATAAMRLVRMPLIRVCVRPDLGGRSAGGIWGDVPLADCGGSVVVALFEVGCSLLALLPLSARAGC
jgi:hypothetical protein